MKKTKTYEVLYKNWQTPFFKPSKPNSVTEGEQEG